MAVSIKLKRTSTPSLSPSTAQITTGELFINTHDGKLFLKKNNGIESIVDLSIAFSQSGGTINATSGTIDTIPISRGGGSVVSNLAIGVSALTTNTTGANNLAFGRFALQNNNASDNLAIGITALQQNTVGFNNIGIGTSALNGNIGGDNNIAIGVATLSNNSGDANNNIAIGTSALNGNIGGDNNIAIGLNTLLLNTAGSNNIAIGTSALDSVSISTNNIGIGLNALSTVSVGNNNLGVGTNALLITTANNNTAFGIFAGNNATTGNDNVFLGYNTTLLNATDVNSIVIGSSAIGIGSNTAVIGTTSTTKTKLWGVLSLDSTIITTNAASFTINKPCGIVRLTAVSSFVVTNSLVNADSIVLCVVASASTRTISRVVPSSGSFQCFLSGNVTAGTRVSFLVISTN
jgi:hypothetical protein